MILFGGIFGGTFWWYFLVVLFSGRYLFITKEQLVLFVHKFAEHAKISTTIIVKRMYPMNT